MRRALVPSRSDTRLDTLMCASSSSDSSRFWSCTRLRVIWYLRRITVRQSRCSASGTKLKVSSCATRRFTNRSASGKSFLRPPAPTIRLRLGEMERARERRRAVARAALRSPVLFQRFPHRPPVLRGRFHDDFLDLVLDEPVGQRAQIGRRSSRPSGVQSGSRRRPRRRPPRRPTSSCARQFPRSGTASASPCGSGERASSHQSGSRAIAGLAEHATTLNYSVNHARSGSNSCSASTCSMVNLDLAAPSAAILPIATIFIVLSRACRPSCNQLRKSSSAASRRRYGGHPRAPGAPTVGAHRGIHFWF